MVAVSPLWFVFMFVCTSLLCIIIVGFAIELYRDHLKEKADRLRIMEDNIRDHRLGISNIWERIEALQKKLGKPRKRKGGK